MGSTNGFLDTGMSGLYFSHDEGDVENGPIASACCVVLWVVESDGCGMLKIMCGLKSTQNNKRGGFTLMLARKHGTILDCIRKVRTFLPVSMFNCS